MNEGGGCLHLSLSPAERKMKLMYKLVDLKYVEHKVM
jgi:hypothetical protein